MGIKTPFQIARGVKPGVKKVHALFGKKKRGQTGKYTKYAKKKPKRTKE